MERTGVLWSAAVRGQSSNLPAWNTGSNRDRKKQKDFQLMATTSTTNTVGLRDHPSFTPWQHSEAQNTFPRIPIPEWFHVSEGHKINTAWDLKSRNEATAMFLMLWRSIGGTRHFGSSLTLSLAVLPIPALSSPSASSHTYTASYRGVQLLPHVSHGIEFAGGKRQTWVPIPPHGVQLVFAFAHIHLSYLAAGLGTLMLL